MACNIVIACHDKNGLRAKRHGKINDSMVRKKMNKKHTHTRNALYDDMVCYSMSY